MMNRLKFLLCTLLVAMLILSCSKDESFFSTKENTENLSTHNGHTHYTSSASTVPNSEIGYEPSIPHIPLVNHPIYTVLEPVLPDKFSAGEVDMLEQGYVWAYEDEGNTVYSIDFKYLDGSIRKLLVNADSENNIKSINILEIFIGSLNNTTSLHNIVVDSLIIYPVDSERNTKGSGSRNSTADCKKIVFGDDPGGNTTNEPGNDGTTVISGPGGTFSGTTYDGGDYLFILVCGCKPAHTGGSANRDCKCRKADRLLIVKKPDLLKEDIKVSSTRNDQDQNYWDCIEELIGCDMLNDYDLAIMTLKHCHAVYDVNDVDNHAGNDGSNQFIGPEFCDEWRDYLDDCLGGSTSLSDVYQPWSGFMIDYPDLFFSTIEAHPECTSTNEMEDIICVENAYNSFVSTFGLNLNSTEKNAIVNGATCGESFNEEAIDILLNILGIDLTPLRIVDIIDDENFDEIYTKKNRLLNIESSYPNTSIVDIDIFSNIFAVLLSNGKMILESEDGTMVEIDSYDDENEIPSTSGWLSCESFDFSIPDQMPSLMISCTEDLIFSWALPSSVFEVGPFDVGVRIEYIANGQIVFEDDAAYCSSWAANRAAKLIGVFVAEFPTLAQENIVVPMFIETMEQGMEVDIITWPTCDPIERVSIVDSNPGLNCTNAIYYSNFFQWLLKCGL